MIKINTSGDYVQLIYVDPVGESVQQELKSDTDAFEVSYDSEGKLYMQFGAMTFQNPDPADFVIDGSPVTDAADFISKLNALFTGGGGGVTIYTGDGSLSGDRTVDLNGHEIKFSSPTYPDGLIYADDETGQVAIGDINGPAYINCNPGVGISYGDASATNFFNGIVAIQGGITGNVKLLSIEEFSDNASALSGGVPSGGVYYTNVAGDFILKIALD